MDQVSELITDIQEWINSGSKPKSTYTLSRGGKKSWIDTTVNSTYGGTHVIYLSCQASEDIKVNATINTSTVNYYIDSSDEEVVGDIEGVFDPQDISPVILEFVDIISDIAFLGEFKVFADLLR